MVVKWTTKAPSHLLYDDLQVCRVRGRAGYYWRHFRQCSWTFEWPDLARTGQCLRRLRKIRKWCGVRVHGEEEKTSSLIVEELVLPRKSSSRLLPLSRRQARDDVRIVVSRLSKAEVNNDGDDDLPSSNVDTDDDEDVHVGVNTVEACFSA